MKRQRRVLALVFLCLLVAITGCVPSRNLGSLVPPSATPVPTYPTPTNTRTPASSVTSIDTATALAPAATATLSIQASPALTPTYFTPGVSGPTMQVTVVVTTPVTQTQTATLTPEPGTTPAANDNPIIALRPNLVPPTPLLPPTPTIPPANTPSPTPSPTYTPSPTPTPCRQSSDFHQLSYYPRPANDTGYGFHINASPYPPDPAILRDQVIPLLKKLNARWVTVWVADDNQVDRVKMLVDSGFEVVLRLHPQGPPHPDFVPNVDWVRKYTAVGVHYVVSGNEPNLRAENKNGKADADAVAWQWVQASRNIKAAGGIPLLYPMSPGGDAADSRVMLREIFEWTKQHGMLNSFDGAGVAIHNRPLNKPLTVRDSTSFLEYEWIDGLVNSYLGRSLPLIGTEAGYTYNDLVDPRYPRITAEMQRDYNMAIITGFRDGRWRDSLFAEDFWILSGFGHYAFQADWWVNNPLYFGKDLPIVSALENLPPFVRRVSCN